MGSTTPQLDLSHRGKAGATNALALVPSRATQIQSRLASDLEPANLKPYHIQSAGMTPSGSFFMEILVCADKPRRISEISLAIENAIGSHVAFEGVTLISKRIYLATFRVNVRAFNQDATR